MVNHISGYRHNINEPVVLYYYIQAYIKMHFSYVRMREMYPDNITFYRYEDLIRSNYSLLKNIATQVSGPNKFLDANVLQRAINLINPNRLKQLEKASNTTLAGDQKIGTDESHIRSTGIYNWRNKYSDEQLHFIEAALRRFCFSIIDFDIGERINFDQSKIDDSTDLLLRIEEKEKTKKYYTVKK